MRAILMFHNQVRDKVTRQCPQTTTFEEKGELKRIRTDFLKTGARSFIVAEDTVPTTPRASLSGSFLQTLPECMVYTPLKGHSLSLSGSFLQTLPECMVYTPLKGHSLSLSGSFLQTLPECMVYTPLKGHSLSPRSCPVTLSAPPERFLVLILKFVEAT